MKSKTLIFSSLLLLLFACRKEEVWLPVILLDSPGNSIQDIRFINDQIGFACGGVTYESCFFARTTDGGEHWDIQTDIPAKKMNFIQTATQDHTLFMSGTDGFICQSADSGKSWSVVNRNVWLQANDIYARSQNDYFMAVGPGEHSGRLLQYDSNSYGFTWRDSGVACNAIAFASQNTAYAAVHGGVKKSMDGGRSWNYTSARGDVFIRLYCLTENRVVTVGRYGSVLITDDGGANWQRLHMGNLPFAAIRSIEDVYFADADHWYLCGRNGLLWRTDDAGAHFTALDAGDYDFMSVWKQNGHLYLGTLDGKILRL